MNPASPHVCSQPAPITTMNRHEGHANHPCHGRLSDTYSGYKIHEATGRNSASHQTANYKDENTYYAQVTVNLTTS